MHRKYLQKLAAILIVSDGKDLFVITGAGDVLTPKHDIAVRGSGGNSALAGGGVMMTNGNLSVERIDGWGKATISAPLSPAV